MTFYISDLSWGVRWSVTEPQSLGDVTSLLSRRILRSRKGTDLAKITWHAADLTPPHLPVLFPDFHLSVTGRWETTPLGTCWGPGRGQSWRKPLSALCPATAEWPCACHRLVSSALCLWLLGKQQRCSPHKLGLHLVFACLFKFSGGDTLSRRAGKPAGGSPLREQHCPHGLGWECF